MESAHSHLSGFCSFLHDPKKDIEDASSTEYRIVFVVARFICFVFSAKLYPQRWSFIKKIK
jgi:hypothetical protein